MIFLSPTYNIIQNMPTNFQRWVNSMVDDFTDAFDNAINNSYAKEVFGTDDEEYYNRVNDILYFIVYMYNFYDTAQTEVTAGTCKTINEYIEEYKIECLRKTMRCRGIDIIPALKLLNLYPSSDNYWVSTCGIDPSQLGIGYMVIEDPSNIGIETLFIIS